MYEVFCKGEDSKVRKNVELVPFLKYLVKLNKNLEEVVGSQEGIADEMNNFHSNEKRSMRNAKKENQALIKQHFNKILKDKDMAIMSLKAAVTKLGQESQQKEKIFLQELEQFKMAATTDVDEAKYLLEQ